MRIAIIGSGVAGLGAAWMLRDQADITLLECQDRLGGHSHTVDVREADGSIIPVDTGFIVYNKATYPHLIAFFDHLKVPTQDSNMSFAASLRGGTSEYAGHGPFSLVGHAANAFSRRHWQMIKDLLRFFREGHSIWEAPADQSMRRFLTLHGYSSAFAEDHLIPMAAAIWSASPQHILDFPARSFGEFYRNHGLLEVDTNKRPIWRTVTGGSRMYVNKIKTDLEAKSARIVLKTRIEKVVSSGSQVKIYYADGTTEDYDHVVMAAHADETLKLLPEINAELKKTLGCFYYSANKAYLHSDANMMPKRKHLWASWNFMQPDNAPKDSVFVSYWMNRLQNLPTQQQYFVTLNPLTEPKNVIKAMTYHHPQYDNDVVNAQNQLGRWQGEGNIWLCGSYFGYGFHEDAFSSGLAVAEALGAPRPWNVKNVSPSFKNATPRPANV